MANTRISKKVLVKEIENAFANVILDPKDPLVTDLKHWEADDLIMAFKGKHWRDIPLKDLYINRFAISLLTPSAFLFYLPAFLVKPILARYGSKYHPGEIEEFIFYNLTPPPEENNCATTKLLDRIKQFTPEQESAVRNYIKYWLDDNPTYTKLFGEKAKIFWKL